METQTWLLRPSIRRTIPRMRLICLPYAGGGAQIYRNYGQELPADVEVCAVQLPGRERRIREPALESVDAIVDHLAPVLGPEAEVPYVVFGHSLGALVGFELVRRLRSEGYPLPRRLFACAHRAPHLPDPDPPIHQLPNDRFIEELRGLNGTPQAVFDSQELLDLFLPVLRADFTAAETYIYRSGAPLPCAITAIGGTGDNMISREAMQAWREHTSGDFELHFVEGDHFFIHQRHKDVMRILRYAIANVLA